MANSKKTIYAYGVLILAPLEAAQGAIARGGRRKALLQHLVNVGEHMHGDDGGAGNGKRERAAITSTPSTQTTPETVKKVCENNIQMAPRALSFSEAVSGIGGNKMILWNNSKAKIGLLKLSTTSSNVHNSIVISVVYLYFIVDSNMYILFIYNDVFFKVTPP